MALHSHIVKNPINSAVRPEVSKYFSRATQSALSFLFLIYDAPLLLTVATVTRHSISSVTGRQAGGRLKSAYLMELELHFTCERINMSAAEKNTAGGGESDDKLVPKKGGHFNM